MKLKIISDLHLEFSAFKIPYDDENILIIAGDMSPNYDQALESILEYLKTNTSISVIVVLGNHDYYHNNIVIADKKWKTFSQDRLYVLQDESIVIDKIRFYGSTMWTDMKQRDPIIMNECLKYINDFRTIDDFTPEISCNLHEQSLQKLETTLKESAEPVVVITHHLPSYKSITDKWKNCSVIDSFASTDLDKLIKHPKVGMWIHGHTHDSLDYYDSNTRVICNPRGYTNVFRGFIKTENKKFNPNLVIDLDKQCRLVDWCTYSFKDLMRAAGRSDDTTVLYAMSQEDRNKEVKKMCQESGWYWKDMKSYETIYTAFSPNIKHVFQ